MNSTQGMLSQRVRDAAQQGTVQTSESPQAPSIISSPMTDIVSEDGDEYRPEGAAMAAAKHSARVSLGESIRPASSQQDAWNLSSASRRNLITSVGSGNGRGMNAFGGPGVSMSNSSRPQSAVSRTSRTHVPSLASHAFFRPMSSQRLQAQRGGRPPQTTESGEGGRDRRSLNSIPNALHEQMDRDLMPPSRGTDITEHDPRDRASLNASPTGNATIQSASESTRPLQKSAPHLFRPYGGYVHQRDNSSDLNVPKSTGSFRSSFLLPTQRDSPAFVRSDVHNTLQTSPRTMSPHLVQDKTFQQVSVRAGKNHEHFSGNTFFCWGGRIQNTREMPINFATGTLVVLPVVLFLIFS